jgi:hypothetical protein
MSLIFRRRLALGKNLGLNISKSGISPSYRTKYGSISFKGISMRTGIPGLTMSKRWGSSKGKGANPLQVLLVIVMAIALVYLVIVFVINLVLLLFWLIAEIRRAVLRFYYRKRIREEMVNSQVLNSPSV